MTAKKKERPVVVTTAHRGVFVGYTTDDADADTITLTRARMIVYWPRSNRGLLGLAADGPKDGSRVSPAVDSITVRNVTAVMAATHGAAEAWERAPWS